MKCNSCRARTLALALALAFVSSVPAASASDPRGRKSVRSLQEIRQSGVVRQQWDLSCGAAALSTLLTFHVGDAVGEPEIVRQILQRSDPVRIRARQGFSLLDLKRFVVSRGHVAEGYGPLDLGQLERLAPAIVPTRLDGYNHFVVFKGIQGDRVLLADPAFGHRTMTIGQFEAVWSPDIAFVVRPSDGGSPRSAGTVTPSPEAPVVHPPTLRQAIGDLR